VNGAKSVPVDPLNAEQSWSRSRQTRLGTHFAVLWRHLFCDPIAADERGRASPRARRIDKPPSKVAQWSSGIAPTGWPRRTGLLLLILPLRPSPLQSARTVQEARWHPRRAQSSAWLVGRSTFEGRMESAIRRW